MDSNLVVCGGTFDHLHQGHKHLLDFALSFKKKVLIGVTSNEFVKKQKSNLKNWRSIESFDDRKKAILGFVEEREKLNKVKIVKIDNLFGPILSKNLSVDTIVVSENTKNGAEIINKKRQELDLNFLKILVVPFVLAEDKKIISSERIRNGEIDRGGKLYIKKSWLKKDLILPEQLKTELKKPFGEIVELIDREKDQFLMTVGDVTTEKFERNLMNQMISVVDFRVARKKIHSSVLDLGFHQENIDIITINNPAGQLTRDIFTGISKIFKSEIIRRTIFKINGEDDLVVLPLILAAPLGSIIYYGQPGAGLVKIIISERIKNKAYNIVSKFEQK